MTGHGVALRIAPDHPCLAGHFPGFPIIPGVVLLDETLHAIEQQQQIGPACWTISAVKFHHTVAPGDELRLSCDWQPDAQVHFELRSAQGLVASGTIQRRAQMHTVGSAR